MQLEFVFLGEALFPPPSRACSLPPFTGLPREASAAPADFETFLREPPSEEELAALGASLDAPLRIGDDSRFLLRERRAELERWSQQEQSKLDALSALALPSGAEQLGFVADGAAGFFKTEALAKFTRLLLRDAKALFSVGSANGLGAVSAFPECMVRPRAARRPLRRATRRAPRAGLLQRRLVGEPADRRLR
jgi:hypothetical protein